MFGTGPVEDNLDPVFTQFDSARSYAEELWSGKLLWTKSPKIHTRAYFSV